MRYSTGNIAKLRFLQRKFWCLDYSYIRMVKFKQKAFLKMSRNFFKYRLTKKRYSF